ncbi:putative chromosome-partitioning protein ParB [Burkholderiales bacterium]|nr:MAG: ParB/RepB/Spo0J family partition protein [Burkholderiales bacterium]CAG0969388.1 putative chromosome-partitioning protein ParB [Burkholderiales bacterium]
MVKFKGLGRGLDALLDGDTSQPGKELLKNLKLELLRPGKYQPRSHMDQASLAELAASIKEQGVMQPILVRPVEGQKYEIIAGERRWRAAQLAGLAEVPVLVRDVPDRAALALALVENIQREDLNPLEEAQGLQRLIEEFGLTHEDAAKAVGRSRSAVSNLLRLLQLAPPVQELLLTSKLDMGHARALLPLPGGQQVLLAGQVVQRGLSVREAERMAARSATSGRASASGKAGRAKRLDPDAARLQEALAQALGAEVQLEPQRGGRGRLVIRYSSLDQLDGILEKLRVSG